MIGVRIPDLGVACSPTTPGTIVEARLLLAEILSPSNVSETRLNVLA